MASPVIFYQLWQFVAPGLYRHERKLVVPFLVLGTLFFVAGGAFGYYVACVKFQKEPGHWSAFWLYNSSVGKVGNEGRDGTEIDIMEKPWLDDRVQHAPLTTVHCGNDAGPRRRERNVLVAFVDE